MLQQSPDLLECYSTLVRVERARRRWRQSDLAERAGVAQQDVSALERGCYVPPARVHRILAGLGIESKAQDEA